MGNNSKIYYKYRNINGENWKYLLDIILNNQLYCAKYHELNDPMEGYYITKENIPQLLKDYIFNQKGNYRICALAKEDTNKLLWAHYADGFKGIAIGLKTKELVRAVNYNGLHELDEKLRYQNQDITSIFFNKMQEWEYENEMRVVLKNSRGYIKIEVVEIIFGLRIDKNLKELLISLIQGLNRNITIKQQNRNFKNQIINK